MREWAMAVAAGLSLWGALEFYSASRSVTADPYRVAEQLGRYAPLAQLVKPEETLGYFSDTDNGQVQGQVLFFVVQYAIAPRLLLSKPEGRLVLGNFTKPQDFRLAGEKYGLEVQQDLGNGVVLYKRREKR